VEAPPISGLRHVPVVIGDVAGRLGEEKKPMTPLANRIEPLLPALRRYAFALTGNRQTGDWYVRVTLETLLEEPSRISAAGDVKFQLYKLLGEVLAIDGPASFDGSGDPASVPPLTRSIASLPVVTRHLLLLVSLEGFSVRRAGELFGLSEREAEAHLAWARRRCGSPARPTRTSPANARRAPLTRRAAAAAAHAA
jgi:DNA-directed RNA polymerase specialized sigma24 family protein